MAIQVSTTNHNLVANTASPIFYLWAKTFKIVGTLVGFGTPAINAVTWTFESGGPDNTLFHIDNNSLQCLDLSLLSANQNFTIKVRATDGAIPDEVGDIVIQVLQGETLVGNRPPQSYVRNLLGHFPADPTWNGLDNFSGGLPAFRGDFTPDIPMGLSNEVDFVEDAPGSVNGFYDRIHFSARGRRLLGGELFKDNAGYGSFNQSDYVYIITSETGANAAATQSSMSLKTFSNNDPGWSGIGLKTTAYANQTNLDALDAFLTGNPITHQFEKYYLVVQDMLEAGLIDGSGFLGQNYSAYDTTKIQGSPLDNGGWSFLVGNMTPAQAVNPFWAGIKIYGARNAGNIEIGVVTSLDLTEQKFLVPESTSGVRPIVISGGTANQADMRGFAVWEFKDGFPSTINAEIQSQGELWETNNFAIINSLRGVQPVENRIVTPGSLINIFGFDSVLGPLGSVDIGDLNGATIQTISERDGSPGFQVKLDGTLPQSFIGTGIKVGDTFYPNITGVIFAQAGGSTVWSWDAPTFTIGTDLEQAFNAGPIPLLTIFDFSEVTTTSVALSVSQSVSQPISS